MRLFTIRQTILFFGLTLYSVVANAQLVDYVLGQKRSTVSVLMRSHRIVDYKLERVVHEIGQGIHQTVFYANDTCNKFYWAVPTGVLPEFEQMLSESGYKTSADNRFVKDSLALVVRPLGSGSATLFIAVLSPEMKKVQAKQVVQKSSKKSSKKGRKTSIPSQVELEAMPLLQQAILAEEADSTAKPPKDPKRHWVGEREGKTNILGW